MINCPHPLATDAAALRAAFLSLLPRLERHGRIAFCALRADQREEALAEMLALAWTWFVRLAKRGRDATRFASMLATFAARAVKSGRRLCGQEKAHDVLSAMAQRRHGFRVEQWPENTIPCRSLLREALADNTVTPPDEQVAFRLDFAAWLVTRTPRDQDVAADLMRGERTLALARKYGLTPARISQLRRDFADDWQRFCGDGPRPASPRGSHEPTGSAHSPDPGAA